MSYQVLVTREAEDDLDAIVPFRRNRILDAMERYLVHQPRQESRSRIKRLRQIDSPEFRLRVGDYRVFYDVDDIQLDVTVLRVLSKVDSIRYLETLENVL